MVQASKSFQDGNPHRNNQESGTTRTVGTTYIYIYYRDRGMRHCLTLVLAQVGLAFPGSCSTNRRFVLFILFPGDFGVFELDHSKLTVLVDLELTKRENRVEAHRLMIKLLNFF